MHWGKVARPCSVSMQLAVGESPLQLRFLGALDVSIDGNPVDVPTRLRWVLARLALERAPLRRSSLAQTFWNKGATQSLRQALYALRSLPESDRWLTVTRDRVALHARCDVVSFYDLVAHDRFIEALALGPLQLFNESMVERTPEGGLWLDAERERYEDSVRRCLLGAARAHIDRDDPSAALACVDRALERDPLDEPVAREGMRACAQLGDLRGALDRYERLRRSLLDSLGVEPTEQTDAYADELARAHRRAPAWPAARDLARDDVSIACVRAVHQGDLVLIEGADLSVRSAVARALNVARSYVALSVSPRPSSYAFALEWLRAAGARAPLESLMDAAAVFRAPSDARRTRAQIAAALRASWQDRAVCVDDFAAIDRQSAVALLDSLDRRPMGAVLFAAWDALDPSVREILTARSVVRHTLASSLERPALEAVLAGVSRAAWRLAQWLSIDDHADDALISAVTGLDAADRADAFDALERRAVVFRRCIATPALREALRATVSESVERGWRRTAALWFEAAGEQGLAAAHWDACGEPSRAVDGWIANARTLVALFDHDAALSILARAADQPTSARQRFDLAALRERCFAISGAIEPRAAAIDAMESSARALQTDGALLEASLRRLAFARETGRYRVVLSACDDVEGDALRAGLHEAWLRARAERAVALLRTGSIDDAEQVFAQLSAASDPAASAAGDYGLGAVAGYRLQLDEARRKHERVLTAARARGDLGMVARALNGLAATAERAGQRRRAAERFVEAAELARSAGDHEASRVAEVNAALAWVFGGRPAEALRLLDDERCQDRALLRPEALESHARAVLWLELGALSSARAAFDRTIALADAGRDARRASHARLDRAFTEPRWERCLSLVEAELEGDLTRDVAALTWLELALVAPTADFVRSLLARAGSKLGSVASLLASLARLRVGEDDGAALDLALGEVETVFALVGLRLCATRRRGAAKRAAVARFEVAFEEATAGLDRALARSWREWIDVRAARDLAAPWAGGLRGAAMDPLR